MAKSPHLDMGKFWKAGGGSTPNVAASARPRPVNTIAAAVMTVALVPSRRPAATTSTRYPGVPELLSPPPVHADAARRNQPQARYPTEASTTHPRRVAQARRRMIVQPKAV